MWKSEKCLPKDLGFLVTLDLTSTFVPARDVTRGVEEDDGVLLDPVDKKPKTLLAYA